jgi:hypothetical protein
MIDRRREGTLKEEFKVLGSTANVSWPANRAAPITHLPRFIP